MKTGFTTGDTEDAEKSGTGTNRAGRWTDVVSHIELLCIGYDEKLEADPTNLRLLFHAS